MKTFKQLQESIYKALAKFGTTGLRKVTSQVAKSKKIIKYSSERNHILEQSKYGEV